MLALLGPIESLMKTTLYAIHDATGFTWAWCIIVLTVVVRVAILPITAKQTTSMKKMQQLQPYILQLQERYKHDRQELTQRTMEFYRDNKHNPLASCLPLLIQIPIFISLFFTLKSFATHPPKGPASDLSFLGGFIEDITDKINAVGVAGAALVVIYVASQILSSRVMATSSSPAQRLMFYILPIVFVPFILGFPVGVMLYWITTNLWTLGQYLVISSMYTPSGEVVMPRDDKRDADGSRRVVSAPTQSRKASDAPASNTSHTQPPKAARRNKRRR